jgi:(1->4)-alpha-D-glucan 1-alpha-D-glucosylmutase
MAPPILLATYRLQFTSTFAFDEAARIAPYLKALGVSHVYASPFLKAQRGSTHGYDVIDHTQLNPELGGEVAFERFCSALRDNDLGLILDFVPNHVGVHYSENAWWQDVLEWGPKSPHAASFDIDWDILPFRSKPGVLLPILGTSYSEALTSGAIELRFEPATGSFAAWYLEHRLPITPERYSDILRHIVSTEAAPATDHGRALLDIAQRYAGPHNPNRKTAPALKNELIARNEAHGLITTGLAAYRTGPDRTAATTALHHLLERQHYRLAYWRLATSEINYRRFFDINTLAGLRIEDRRTFDRVHVLVRRLIAEDKIQGLRLDHIDGLQDPAQYFVRLRRLIHEAQGSVRKAFPRWIEKILGEDEPLPSFVEVSGTTGYEWLNAITRVLLEPNGLIELDDIWRQASNSAPSFETVLHAAKRRVLETMLASEFTVLVRLLARIAAGHYSTRDISEASLRQAFELFVLNFPVYRTYITAAGAGQNDRVLIETTIEKARKSWFGADAEIFDFLRDTLTLDLVAPGRAAHSRPRVLRFALKVQQFTGPLMAKSLEDTAFYRYPRLLALNEVGGSPAAAALSAETFHEMLKTRASRWPQGLTTTATHDTKRGEDARTRILALTELASDWAYLVGRWKILNARFVTTNANSRIPSIVDEYLLYQSLIGSIPANGITPDFVDHLKAYLQKAVREAKLETSWLNPNVAYEDGVAAFIDAILNPEASSEFLSSLFDFAARSSLLGALNSLTQLTLKATMPGVPDFYQGTELWDLSFVDPDNRQPVNFGRRKQLLDQIDNNWQALSRDWADGRIKLAWTAHLLCMRRRAAAVFALGGYRPLTVTGAHRSHVIAFARVHKQKAAVVLALRHFATLTDSGRRWPKFDALNAQVPLDESELRVDTAVGNLIEVGAVLSHVPAVILLGGIKPSRLRVARAGRQAEPARQM